MKTIVMTCFLVLLFATSGASELLVFLSENDYVKIDYVWAKDGETTTTIPIAKIIGFAHRKEPLPENSTSRMNMLGRGSLKTSGGDKMTSKRMFELERKVENLEKELRRRRPASGVGKCPTP